MRSDATSQRGGWNTTQHGEPVEFSVEDAMLNTWVEDTGQYLRLDTADYEPIDGPIPEAN